MRFTQVIRPRSAPVRAALIITGGLLAASVLVWQTSNAAFSASTSNGTNTWSAGTVSLTDDDSAAAMFTATAMVPGATGTKCIKVTYGGDVASAVELYSSGLATTNALASHIDLTIEQGTGGSFSGCAGFTPDSGIYSGTIAAFGASNTSFATGVGAWAPTGAAETKEYRFTWTLNNAAPSSVMGGTASLNFVWESQA